MTTTTDLRVKLKDQNLFSLIRQKIGVPQRPVSQVVMIFTRICKTRQIRHTSLRRMTTNIDF